MNGIKKHAIQGLTAYYLKKGRNWWVESAGGKAKFNSIEDMVAQYPILLDIEPIKNSVERREFSNKTKDRVQLAEHTADHIEERITECYYCAGHGTAGVLPCPNCDGSGKIRVTAVLS